MSAIRATTLLLASAMAPSQVAADGPPQSAQLPKDVVRGRGIYLEGRDADSSLEVKARIGGEDGVEVPAWTLPCVTCHGADGSGGMPGQDPIPSDIRGATLGRAQTTAGGRKRPAYPNREAIRRAVTAGFDPAEQSLSTVMPRYRLSPEQWAALGAYLETLGE